MSDNLFTCAVRAGKRVDYHQLNDRSDDEVDNANRVEPVPKQPYSPPNSFKASIE